MGLRKKLRERKKRQKKMERKEEWYSERKMTEGRNKKEEWVQRGGEEEREIVKS
jgi:hypothetical protein